MVLLRHTIRNQTHNLIHYITVTKIKLTNENLHAFVQSHMWLNRTHYKAKTV